MTNLPLYRKMFQSTLAYSSIRAFFSVSTALLTILIIRFLGPEEFGKFSLILQLAVTLGLFFSWGSSSTLAKFLPERPTEESKARLSSQIAEICLLSLLLFSFLFLILIHFLPKLFPAEIKGVQISFVSFVCLFALFNVLQGIFRGLGRFLPWSWIEGLNDFLARALTLLLIFFFLPRYTLALYTYLGVLFLCVFWAALSVRNQFSRQDLRIEKSILQFSLLMILGSAIFMAGASLDAVLLRGLLKDPNEVGFYFAGTRIPQTFQSLLLAPLSVPFLYYFTHPETFHTRDQVIRLGTKVMGASCAAASLLLFSLAKPIVEIFYSSFYIKSVPVLKIYSFVFFAMGLQVFVTPFMMAINKVHVQLWIGVLSIGLLLGLDLWLIPRWQSSGSALANLIMLSLQALIYNFWMSRHQLPILRPVLLLVLGIAVSVTLEMTLIPFIALPCFLLFLVSIRFFSTEEMDKIQKVVFHKADAAPN
ncbi:MAG: lipopolysaccharide biosynthesis protein [Elusimicrobia bacterium]|nr:lipopolysaccharide biosynthesis protein [Elusimicrobiota bacterium]